jgi:leucyl-tRNA synthetase
MVDRYNPQETEGKWRRRWEEDRLYEVKVDPSKPKWYALTMFPYTSGDLHIGHWFAEVPADVQARYMRMKGYNVLHPMGFDAFGLPAENAAISRGIHPYTWTMDNIERMRTQLRSIGASYDWTREVITCQPEYYRWTQWLFLKLYEAGLAYRSHAPANWCPSCNTVLANEQVLADGTCERCGTEVYRRDLEQWFFRITKYADDLLDYSRVQWPENIITMQKNWIGKSLGTEICFGVEGSDEELRVFTTRPDTVYGVSFMAIAPEHPLVEKLINSHRRTEMEEYIAAARRQSEIERLSTEREKTGIFTGRYAVNLLNGQRVPIFVADYVLLSYGTGAVMGVPAHDQRDFEFAKRYGLPISVVIAPEGWDGKELAEAFVEPGVMINSGPFDGLPSEQGKESVTELLEERGWGTNTVSYRLRDWLVSRQRYWGAPIPIIYCPECGTVPVPESDLPVLLPQDAEFRPTGESPLKYNEGFVNTTCPKCGHVAQRETDTMDTFVCSSWYMYRYASAQYDKAPIDPEAGRYWLPVDQYTGGAEHATMHLLYARFFALAMRDLGLIEFSEPFTRLFSQGIILGEDHEKMSKSRGNVVNPDELVAELGADTVRAYLMFIGPWDQGGAWNSRGINGIHRWLYRVWNLVLGGSNGSREDMVAEDEVRNLRRQTHKTIRKVSQDIEGFRFNTMLAALMEFSNYLGRLKGNGFERTEAWKEAIESLILLLAPSVPHLAEELWSRKGHAYSVHNQPFPSWDEALAADDEITLVIQVNGRLRDRLSLPADVTESEAKEKALSSPKVRPHLDGKELAKVIYVPGRLVNLVTD